jgi:hypothetical protein
MRRTTAAAVTAVALILGTVALTMPSTPQHPTKGTTMASPGNPSSQIPPGEDHVMRRLADIERYLRELTPSVARSIAPTVARLDAADVANAAQDAATAANVAAIAANVASINTLIGTQVQVANATGASNGMAITVADADLATASITVPAGYSQALVFLAVTTGAYNNTATYAYLYIEAVINGVATRLSTMPATGPGDFTTVATAKSVTLTGLSGGTISLAARVRCDNGWAADASNRAYSEAIVVFLR